MKKKTVRVLTFLLSFVLLLSAFAGCEKGQTDGTDTTEGTTNQPIDAITVVENGKIASDARYTNALEDSAADPFIFYKDGTYYLYSTGSKTISVRTSTNLRVWTKQTEPALRLSNYKWASDSDWAPEVYEYNGKFYMIFSAKGTNGLHAIDIGVASSPTGPFMPLSDKPFYAPAFSVIDASLLFDDGHIYLYYSKDCSTNNVSGKKTSQVFGVEVKTDFSGLIGEPTLLATPQLSWESSGSTIWNEGPVVIHQKGKYFLLYSANYYKNASYSVGYAVSDNPLGAFVKPTNNRILVGDGKTLTGTGHCNYFVSPDGSEIYLCYHRHTVAPNSDGGRSLCIDRLIIGDDATLYVDGPSANMHPIPSGVSGYTVKHDGFSVSLSSEDMRLSGKVEYAANEMIYDGKQLNMKDGAELIVKMDEPTDLYGMFVYGTSFADYQPESVEVLINGTYRIESVFFPEKVGNPVQIGFGKLPQGTLINEIRLTFHKKESAAADDLMCLSEIMLIERAN